MEKDPNLQRFRDLLALGRLKYGNDSKVATALGVKPGHVSQWKSGKHRVPPHTVEALGRLVTPEKYPMREESVIIAGESAGKRFASNVRESASALAEAMRRLTAPLIATARGGEGSYPEDQGNNVPRIAVPCKDPNCYVLELEGDSMHPNYLPGDLLVVAPNLEPRNNDLVVVRTVDDEVLFKQFKHPKRGAGEQFQFVSFNPHHPPLYLRPDQIFKVSVVHSVIRPLREKVQAMTVR